MAVVAFVLGYGEWESAAGIHVAVKDICDGVPGFLAWYAGVKDGCDVGVINPVVYNTDAGGMNDNDGVGVVCSYVLDEVVAEGIGQRYAVEAFGRVGIDEDDCCICIHVWWAGVLRIKVPA